MRISLEDLKAAVRHAERAGVDEVELVPVANDDGLAGWPRSLRVGLAAEKALRSIRDEFNNDKEKK